MFYHLIVKYKDSQKLYSSFSSLDAFPEIKVYLKEKSIFRVDCLEIGIQDIVKLASQITNQLNVFFANKYIQKEYKALRPKSIQQITYLYKKYDLHIASIEYKRLRFLEQLNQMIKNNGIMILYGRGYLTYDLIQILSCINNEKLKSKKDIVTRVNTIKDPDLDVNEALKELEEKKFIIINQESILPTEKGRLTMFSN